MIKNNLKNNTNFQLSIQLNLDGFSFCIKKHDTQEVTTYKSIPFTERAKNPIDLLEKVALIFGSEDSLQQTFHEIVLIHQNELNTIVPDPYFKEEHLATYLQYNVKVFENDFIAFDELPILQAKSVYIPYVNVNNYLFDHFGSFTYLHANTLFIQKCLNLQREVVTVAINVFEKQFHLVVTQNQQLLFSNTFDNNCKEDFVYFILFTCEQLKLDPNSVDVQLFGNIHHHDDNFKLLYKYIRNVAINETILPNVGLVTNFLLI